jgi:hypothetical protein
MDTSNAGVAELVDAQDLKSAQGGFGQHLLGAESPFFILIFRFQRFMLKYTGMWDFVW